MGNCIHSLCHQPEERSRVLIYNGGEKLFKASTRVKKITSGHFHVYKLVHQDQPDEPLSPNSRLEPGEACYLVPPNEQPWYSLVLSSKLASLGTCKAKDQDCADKTAVGAAFKKCSRIQVQRNCVPVQRGGWKMATIFGYHSRGVKSFNWLGFLLSIISSCWRCLGLAK